LRTTAYPKRLKIEIRREVTDMDSKVKLDSILENDVREYYAIRKFAS
jgi:hypothetical protein